MRSTFLVIALSWAAASADADLAAEKPEDLCILLQDFGLKTTAFVAPGEGERPLCYTESKPKRIAEFGYEYSYRVLSHWEWDTVQSLFLLLQGHPDKILGKEPYSNFVRMSERILSAFLDEPDMQQVLHALQELAPGEHRHATVRGINVQLHYVDYSFLGIGAGVELRLDLDNVCNYSPTDARGRETCIAEYEQLQWSPSRF